MRGLRVTVGAITGLAASGASFQEEIMRLYRGCCKSKPEIDVMPGKHRSSYEKDMAAIAADKPLARSFFCAPSVAYAAD